MQLHSAHLHTRALQASLATLLEHGSRQREAGLAASPPPSPFARPRPPTCSTRLPLRRILRVIPVTGRGCTARPPPLRPRPPAAARAPGCAAGAAEASPSTPAQWDHGPKPGVVPPLPSGGNKESTGGCDARFAWQPPGNLPRPPPTAKAAQLGEGCSAHHTWLAYRKLWSRPERRRPQAPQVKGAIGQSGGPQVQKRRHVMWPMCQRWGWGGLRAQRPR